ncbi:MAG: type II CAAX endopeptidase family protein [Candidatus Sulfopaludibacter sp.]|nr:type II CAAX endopeptidase family protein [Candidatus Sulfopaludibacter sp.]
MNRNKRSQCSVDDVEYRSRARWISAGEAITGSLIVLGYNVWHILPNSVPLLFAMGLISFRLREGSWTAMGLGLPRSWTRTALMAVGAAFVQQALGQFVVDPLTQPFLHYSARANPLETIHGSPMALRWLGIIWTYAAFGEEIGYRGYLLNRVADLGGRTRTALAIGLLWSSIMFGFAHWYQGPAGIVSSVVSGIVFGAAYLLAGGNLWVAVLAHGFSDSLALLFTYVGLAS